MKNDLKGKIHKLIDKIADEKALNALNEDAAIYAAKEKISDDLTEKQLKEIQEALAEVERGETISHEEFKMHTAEWIKKLS